MAKQETKQVSPWEQLNENLTVPYIADPPWVSYIVPTRDCAQTISITLDSLANQIYSKLEVIVVDAGSQDKTLETVRSYGEEMVRLFTVADYNIYEMWNKGASRAKGRYLSFLFPGDFLIWPHAISYVMSIAEEQTFPSLIYCGSIIRDGVTEPRILYRALNSKNLAQGFQPTALSACWFQRETFEKAGRFDPEFALRGGLDLFCRLHLWEGAKHVSTTRTLTDHSTRRLTQLRIWRHFWDTLRIVYRYFGFAMALRWSVHQKDLERSLRLWLRRVRGALLGH